VNVIVPVGTGPVLETAVAIRTDCGVLPPEVDVVRSVSVGMG